MGDMGYIVKIQWIKDIRNDSKWMMIEGDASSFCFFFNILFFCIFSFCKKKILWICYIQEDRLWSDKNMTSNYHSLRKALSSFYGMLMVVPFSRGGGKYLGNQSKWNFWPTCVFQRELWWHHSWMCSMMWVAMVYQKLVRRSKPIPCHIGN